MKTSQEHNFRYHEGFADGIEWCKEHIGKPFEMSDEPNFIGFDYQKGLWGCYQGYNRFNVGYDSPDLRDNWVFKNEKDATWFAWRWL